MTVGHIQVTATAARAPMAWRPVLAVGSGTVALLIAYAGRYGYNVDELYFRLLGERGAAWGYIDQPSLLPLLHRVFGDLFGDTLWAIRVPAALCSGAVVVLGSMITAELGGRTRAQVLTAIGLGTSSMVLSVGHILVTSTLDLLAWTAVLLFAARALLRRDGRWWLAVGVVCGLAVFAKYIVVLLPVSMLLGLALVGPRSVFRDRKLAAGMGIALLIGLPNLLYQLLNDLPQLQMARALGSTDGLLNRVVFLPSLVLLLGLALTPIWFAGLLGLLRDPAWRPARAIAVAALAGAALAIVGGGRPDYVGGFLIAMFAAGCVRTDRWLTRGAWRAPVLAIALLFSIALQVLIALPILPQRTLAETALNNISRERRLAAARTAGG